MELDTAASTIEVTDTGVLIRWSDGARSRFHALWLRHNCPTAATASLTELNPDIFVLFAERNDDGDLAVEFSDGHESAFAFEWLQAHSHEAHELVPDAASEHFRAGHAFDQYSFPEADSAAHSDLLDSVDRDGVAIVSDVPPLGIEAVADLFGPMRSGLTDPVIDDYVDTELDDIDSGSSELRRLSTDPHTRGTWRSEPDGIVIIHCLERAELGGELAVVDGFAIANELQDDDPAAFDLLSQTNASFASTEAAHHQVHASIVAVDRNYRVVGVRFDEQALRPLEVEPRQVGEYYRALIEFASAINDPGRAAQVRLLPGQAIVIDNHRVLVGSASVGRGCVQHRQICSVDRDWFVRRMRSFAQRNHRLED